MSDAVLLTFAIPTFNRLDCLKLLVDSLLPHVAAINAQAQRVELMVCNNASSDGTAAYLDAHAIAGRITVVHQASNLGADGNIVSCFERASGRYVWICGDDDLPLPGTVERVVEWLDRERPDLMYLPALWSREELSPYLARRGGLGNVRELDAMALALEADAFITFISSWVIHRSAYFERASATDPARYMGTSLVQLEWTLALLVRGGKLLAADSHWVMARSGNTGGYPVFEVFSTNFDRVVRDKLGQRPELYAFFSQYMLRSYLPVLVWGLRRGALGHFEAMGRDDYRVAIRRVWPAATFARSLLERIATSGWATAFVAFVASRVISRFWLARLRLRVARAGG